MSILQQLHSFWESDGNPNRGSCSKHFVSRERGVSEGVMGVFTPNKVMVIHKVLLTAESAVDMSDCVGACQVRGRFCGRCLSVVFSGNNMPTSTLPCLAERDIKRSVHI